MPDSQTWPWWKNVAHSAPSTAWSMSASSNTMFGDLPPSSSVVFLIVLEASCMIRRPTTVEPVKATLSTSGCEASSSPTVEPPPVITFTTPSGSSVSARISASLQRGQRRVRRRLEHARVAHRERRRQLPDRHHEREVPGNDPGADADRLAQHEVVGVGRIADRLERLLHRPRRLAARSSPSD